MTAVFAGLVTFGFTALLTIAGVGAAFVLIPVFLALGIDVHTAMATALLLNAVAMSVASVNFVCKKMVVWKVALPMVVVASALSPLGAWVSQGLDRAVLLWLFCGLPGVRGADDAPQHSAGAGDDEWERNPTRRRSRSWRRSRLPGRAARVGGGNIIVPALVAYGFDPKKASASTSFVVIFASVAGFLGHMSLAGMDYALLGWTAAGSAAGAALGSWLMTDKLKGRQVKLLIGVVLLGIAVKMAWGLM
jgi:uncharacterized membrane protein YfcA